MTTDRPFSRSRYTLLAFFACILFYGAQVSAQLHGIDHVFHQAGDACSIYHSIEHHKSDVIQHQPVVALVNDFIHEYADHYLSPDKGHCKRWHSRAPPPHHPV